jgi:hypothetical protein
MLLAIICLAGCNEPPPVLSGIPDAPLLQERSSAAKERDATKEQTVPQVYSKPAGVDVDVQNICGKQLKDVQDIILEQLGTFQEKIQIGKRDGERRLYEKGEIRQVGGEIYMLRTPLSGPMRRSEALQRMGFPEHVGKYAITHREYQLTNQWSFRRIRLMRESEDNERVTEIETWKWIPNERTHR